MSLMTWAEHHICAAHRPQGGGVLHGHTWRVFVGWVYSGQDAEELQARLAEFCDNIPSLLPDPLSRAEDLAVHIGEGVGAARVYLWRGAERLGASWRA